MAMDFSNVGRDIQEVYFDRLRTFVVAHEANLQEMEQHLNEKWDGTLWDVFSDTVTVDVGAYHRQTSVADTLGRCKLHNRLFFRLTLVMSSMVVEMRALTEECHEMLLAPLGMFGDPEVGSDGYTDEEAQKGLGKLMPFLMDAWNWVRRVRKVVVVLVRHLASLYSAAHHRDKYAPYQDVHFPTVWTGLVDLLGAVVAFEEVITGHDTMRHGMTVYLRMLSAVGKNPEKYDGADKFELEQFGRLLHKIENDLMTDGIFMDLCGEEFDAPGIAVGTNEALFKEFSRMLSEIAKNLCDTLNGAREGDNRKRVMGVCGLYALYVTVFNTRLQQDPGEQKRSCREVFDLHKICPVVHIHALAVFMPAQWLARRVPKALGVVVRDPVNEGMASIKAECARATRDLSLAVNYFSTVVSVWCAQMQSTFPSTREHAKQYLRTTSSLVLRGITFTQQISRTIRNIVFLHQCADLSLTLPMVDSIQRLIVLLATMRAVLHGKNSTLLSVFNVLCSAHTFIMQRQLYNLHLKLNDNLSTASEAITDQHSALGQALFLLSRPLTPQSLVSLEIVLSIAFHRNECCFESKDYEEAMAAFASLQKLCSFQKLTAVATNCEWLYWQREALHPLFFKGLYQRPASAEQLPYLMLALHDCCPAIMAAKHVDEPATLMQSYVAYVRKCLQENIVAPLLSEVENDLRLQTHGSVLGQPFRRVEKDKTKDLARFTRLAPMRLVNQRYSIRELVEDYLDVQFYNLNALHPNDWKTYEEMRTLAHERYGLVLAEGFLPGSIVDQGLDVLVITKNIQVFIANYTYNLNEQLFVQRPVMTESKHLHTLGVRHISNSIRTHGTGIMNTTVNYVYKCLLKKLSILSQFLYDDHVRSRLLKDIKYFTANKNELHSRYPLGRAERFCNEIRKLGVTDDGKTYLDQFRQLVAEIGNALAYMRMVRSGGLRSIADAAVFIPELDNIPHLERCVNPAARREGEEGDLDLEDIEVPEEADEIPQQVAECTTSAIKIVDSVVSNMSKRLAQGSDYFRMLEEAIAKRLSDTEKYSHLKNFHMIVPPMCLSYVEFMVHQKEQLMKKNKEGLFTDDGFALGIVFLLSLFGLKDAFDSLHWFESVTAHFEGKRKEMDEGIASRRMAKKSDKAALEKHQDGELNSMQLTLTMVQSNLREYELLHCTFNSSRVFFNYQTVEDENEEEEEEEDVVEA